MGTDSQHPSANIWEYHQKTYIFFSVTASSYTSIPFNKGIEDCAEALQAPSQLVTHALRRDEFFLNISH